jgi:hypothetical protein
MKIYTYRPFKIDSLSNDLIDPLYSLTRTGEYYTVEYKPDKTQDDHNIKVYDESLDKFCTMKYKDLALWGLELLRDCDELIVNLGFTKLNAADPANPIQLNTYKEVENHINAGGVLLDIDMIVMRPNIVHRMGSAIMTKSGSETAETVIGYRSLTLSDDGDAGVHKGNFHCWTGTYVKDPCAVVHIPDVVYGGYKSGNTNRKEDNIVIFVNRKKQGVDISCLPTVLPRTMMYGENVMDKSDIPNIVAQINLYYNIAGCLNFDINNARLKYILEILKSGERNGDLDTGDEAVLNLLLDSFVDNEKPLLKEKIRDIPEKIKTILASDGNDKATEINFLLYVYLQYPFKIKGNNTRRNILVNMETKGNSHGDMTPCEYLVQGAQYSLCGEAKDCKWEFTPSRSHLGETADGVRIVREGRMVYGSSDTSHAIRRRD